jgi:hypothetical protein
MTQTQPNKQMVVVIAVIIALLFVGAFFFMKKSEVPTNSNTMMNNGMMKDADGDNDNDGDTNMMESGKNSLMGLMGMGKNLQCDFNYETAGKAGSKGSVYISGKKVRGEFGSEVNGKQTMMNMMQDDGYTYVWGSALPEGIKMKVDTSKNNDTTSGSSQYFDPNQEMNFNCKTWSVDASKFVLPTNITFRDMSAMMNPSGGANNGAAMKAGQCAACAQLQGEAKATCEKQLGC